MAEHRFETVFGSTRQVQGVGGTKRRTPRYGLHRPARRKDRVSGDVQPCPHRVVLIGLNIDGYEPELLLCDSPFSSVTAQSGPQLESPVKRAAEARLPFDPAQNTTAARFVQVTLHDIRGIEIEHLFIPIL